MDDPLHLLATYVRSTRRALRRADHSPLWNLVGDLPRWMRTQGRSGLEDGRPWITFGAARKLERLLEPQWVAFEYGSGGSTLFLSDRVKHLVSVENDPAWYPVVKERLATRTNVELLLVEGIPSGGEADPEFRSRSALFAGMEFEQYVRTIERYPDQSFDLLVIDGRARPAGFFHGAPKVKIGGLVVLDDSNRSGYAAAVAAATAANWPAFRQYGPKPFSPEFAETTVWTKTRELPPGLASS